MAYRVDPGLDAPQEPARDPVRDSATSHPKRDQLGATDNPVLSLGKVTDATVERTKSTLCMAGMQNVPLAGHCPRC